MNPIYRSATEVRAHGESPYSVLYPNPVYNPQIQIDMADHSKSRRTGRCVIFLSALVISNIVSVLITLYIAKHTPVLQYVPGGGPLACVDPAEHLICYPMPDGESRREARATRELAATRRCLLNLDQLHKLMLNTNRSGDEKIKEDSEATDEVLPTKSLAGLNAGRNTMFLFLHHKAGPPVNSVEIDYVYQRLNSWKSEAQISFRGEGLTLNQSAGSIKISEAGVYVVLVQVQFVTPIPNRIQSGSKSKQETATATEHHFGLRLNVGDESIESTETRPCPQGRTVGQSCHTAQVYAAMYLPLGVELNVEAKPFSLLSESYQGSYFSLYKIDKAAI